MEEGCRTGVLHAIVSHGTTSMAGVEDPAKNLGGLIRHVDSGRNVLHLNVPSTLGWQSAECQCDGNEEWASDC